MQFSHRVCGALLGLAMTLLLPAYAAAHGEYRSSDPERGERLNAPPREVTITLTEPPTNNSRMVVVDACGNEVQTDVQVQDYDLTASVASGVPGKWQVAYQVISAADGHATQKTFSFSVAGDTDCSEPHPEPTGNGSDDDSAAPPGEDDSGGFPVLPVVLGTAGVAGIAVAVRFAGGR